VAKKEELAKKIDDLLGIRANWSRMSLKDLQKIYEVLSTPARLLDVLARAAQQRVHDMKVGELLRSAREVARRREPIIPRIMRNIIGGRLIRKTEK